jgi:hypothetical protein
LVDPNSLQIDLSGFPQVFIVGTDDSRTRTSRDLDGDWFKGTYRLTVVSYVLGVDEQSTTLRQQRYAAAITETLLGKPELPGIPDGQKVQLDANLLVNKLSDLELQSRDYVAATATETVWTTSEVLGFGPTVEMTLNTTVGRLS